MWTVSCDDKSGGQYGRWREKVVISLAKDVGHGPRWYHWNQLEKMYPLTPHLPWSEAPEAAKTTFKLNQQYLWPLKSDTVADGLIETAMKICIYRHPTHPDQGPLRPPTPFWHAPPFPAKSIGLIEPLPEGIVVIYKTVIYLRGRLNMTYTLSMVQKEIIYWLIRPK